MSMFLIAQSWRNPACAIMRERLRKKAWRKRMRHRFFLTARSWRNGAERGAYAAPQTTHTLACVPVAKPTTNTTTDAAGSPAPSAGAWTKSNGQVAQ